MYNVYSSFFYLYQEKAALAILLFFSFYFFLSLAKLDKTKSYIQYFQYPLLDSIQYLNLDTEFYSILFNKGTRID